MKVTSIAEEGGHCSIDFMTRKYRLKPPSLLAAAVQWDGDGKGFGMHQVVVALFRQF